MHGNQWVLKIAVLKYYSVSKRGTTAKSNPKQATDPISLHTKFGDNSSNTFPLNERKPCVTPDIGRRTPDIGHRTAKKAKIIYPPPRGVDIINKFKAGGFTSHSTARDIYWGQVLGILSLVGAEPTLREDSLWIKCHKLAKPTRTLVKGHSSGFYIQFKRARVIILGQVLGILSLVGSRTHTQRGQPVN